MRIVHLIDYFQPKLGYQEAHLARIQLQQGHDVTVLCGNKYYPFPNYDETIQPLLGPRELPLGRALDCDIPVVRLHIRLEARSRAWMRDVKSSLRELAPDVVHAHNIVKPHTLQAALYKDAIGYRLVVDDHSHWSSIDQSGTGKAFHRLMRVLGTRRIARQSDALAGITAETVDIMAQVYGMPRSRISLIELGVDTELFDVDSSRRQALREEFQCADGDFLLIYTGKLIDAKGPHLAVEALQYCPDNVKLLLVGNGSRDYLAGIRLSIASHGLGERVKFRPAVPHEELKHLYNAADAGCWPRQASMGMIEAMACGLPIIVIAKGLEARLRADNGLPYTEDDVPDLAKKIMQLSGKRDESRAMGERGRDLAATVYSWSIVNEQFEKLYRGDGGE